MADGYTDDFRAWALTQSDVLRRRSANEVDWDNLAEEMADLGRSAERELGSRLEVLLMHLLKWAYQPDHRGSSWETTINIQRIRLDRHLKKHPSLKGVLEEEFEAAYTPARLEAAEETGLGKDVFPLRSPFSSEQALDDTFWPSLPDENA